MPVLEPLFFYVFFILFLCLVFTISSVVEFLRGNEKISVAFLFTGTLLLGIHVSLINPYLNLWDEQFNALVAKNTMNNFFKPMLYANPVLDYDYKDWAHNAVWLHKQPLFLWQMAISMKLFGVNELGVRLPSIVMHALMPLFIYRIGKISFNSALGYYGALFFAVANYPLQLAVGIYGTDHNDTAFLFYTTASFWAWFEYQQSKKRYWIVLIGIFSGCAVLVKWLVGLLVYSAWGLVKIVKKEFIFNLQLHIDFIISICITFLIFLPWQFYILFQYPLEAHYEYAMNTKHLFEPVENHSGSIWFHIDALKLLYGSGDLIPFILLAGLISLGLRVQNIAYRVALLAPIVIVYLFFSLVSTKIESFCLIVTPFVLLGLASLTCHIIDFLCLKIRLDYIKKILIFLSLMVACFFLVNLPDIYSNAYRPHRMRDMELIKKIQGQLRDDPYVIFNAELSGNGHIPIMFYTPYIAYDFIPSQEQLNAVFAKGFKVAVIHSSTLPEYIKNSSDIYIIDRN